VTDGNYRALVVDDDPAVRHLAMRALTRKGFACSAVVDGLQAMKALASNRYDVVVTDLRMPNLNGHALAVNLLASPNRPALVILTGVLQPRLAEDLIRRGVDCVEFKPVRCDLFAAKVKALVDRRREELQKGFPRPLIREGKYSWN